MGSHVDVRSPDTPYHIGSVSVVAELRQMLVVRLGELTQMSAVAKAVNTAAFTLISASLKECLIEDKSNSEAVTAQLQKLFLSLA